MSRACPGPSAAWSWGSSTSRPTPSPTVADGSSPVTLSTQGLRLAAQGADLVDVGGESTRPGAERPSVEEELRRVLPVVRELAAAGVTVSIDTMRADVAAQALDAEHAMVNDVSGGRADPAMLGVVADAEVPVVLMHWRGHSAHMQELRSTTTWSTTSGGNCWPRLDKAARGRHRARSHRDRSGSRLRQDRRSQLDAARPPARDRRPGLTRTGRGVAQGVPRPPAR